MKRRRCKLANSDYKDVDLRKYEDVIIQTINETVPGKNPVVCKKYFYTDVLKQSEAVSLGRALSKIESLKGMGKTVTTFRLFDGMVCDVENSEAITEESNTKTKGGRMK